MCRPLTNTVYSSSRTAGNVVNDRFPADGRTRLSTVARSRLLSERQHTRHGDKVLRSLHNRANLLQTKSLYRTHRFPVISLFNRKTPCLCLVCRYAVMTVVIYSARSVRRVSLRLGLRKDDAVSSAGLSRSRTERI